MNKDGNDLVKQLGELAFATRLKRLGEQLQHDVRGLYTELDVDFEPKWFTMLYALYHNGTMSIIELAGLLKLTHPAIIQFAAQMQQQKLVQSVRDKQDARKKLLKLTDKGRHTYETIAPVLKAVENCTRDVINNTGIDLLGIIENIERQLDKKNMYTRVKEKLNNQWRQQIEIHSYRTEWKEAFKVLNYEWLNKYFTVEPVDEKVLGNPRKEIIAKGGEVFFAVLDNAPIGTCAVKKVDDNTYELLKMAVTEKYRGRGVGRMLAERAIAFAEEKGVEIIELDTSRKLVKAMKLYEAMGFVVNTQHPSAEYERSTIKMQLILKQEQV